MVFKLSELQVEDLNKWREKIRDLHGKIGIEHFVFCPTGIGDSCIVKNISYGIELDITHEEEW